MALPPISSFNEKKDTISLSNNLDVITPILYGMNKFILPSKHLLYSHIHAMYGAITNFRSNMKDIQ